MLCVLHKSGALLDTWFANISPSLCLLILFLTVLKNKCLQFWWSSKLPIFFLYGVLVLCLRIFAQSKLTKVSSCVFSREVLRFSVLDSFWVIFCTWCEVCIKVHLLTYEYPFVLALFIQKNRLYTMSVHAELYSVLLSICVSLCEKQSVLITTLIIIRLEVKLYNSPLFFSACFDSSRSFVFPCEV